MDDKKFKKMDEKMMKAMEPLRSKEVSPGILKGFSASVERKIAAAQEEVPSARPARLVWAPAAVMAALALFVVIQTPIKGGWQGVSFTPALELAQLTSEQDIQEELSVLIELGELDEEAGIDLLGAEDELVLEGIELTQKTGQISVLA